MRSRVVFVEPLLAKLSVLLQQGERECLDTALTLFGTEADIAAVVSAVRDEWRRSHQHILVVDLTPFVSLGNETRLEALGRLHDEIPFAVVARPGVALEQVQAIRQISWIVCNETGEVVDSHLAEQWAHLGDLSKQGLGQGGNALSVHADWIEHTLMSLARVSLRRPPEGTRFGRLHDGAWANMWIDVKAAVSNLGAAFFAAYQMGYRLTRGYSRPLDENCFMVSNNNSLVVASLLHQIFPGKELVVLDRLGPYPSFQGARTAALDRIDGKKVVLVEDVVSSGREVDMTHLACLVRRAEMRRAVCLFNLEVARPKLLPESSLLSLCRPSRRLRYLRRPMYSDARVVTRA